MNDDRALSATLDRLEGLIQHPESGLPEPLFHFLSRISPLINVDLLIQNDRGETLLTWRDDPFFGPGWHVPGGIVRFHEKTSQRIEAVAEEELGAAVLAENTPCHILESIMPAKESHSHGISLLYRCHLLTELQGAEPFDPQNPKPGQWQWHASPPQNLISEQAEYRGFLISSGGTNKNCKRMKHWIPSKQLLRYLIVGAWNTVFGYSLFAFLNYVLSDVIPASYLAASLLSNLIAITVSFLGYKWWVFKTKGHYFREWLKALTVYSSAMLLNLALLPPTVFALAHFTGNPVTAPYLAGALLTGMSVTISFLGHKNFTFKRTE